MLSFIKTGGYALSDDTVLQYPYITILDLHVHCYALADKYDLPALADYAVEHYVRISAAILSLNWATDDPGYNDGSMSNVRYDNLSLYSYGEDDHIETFDPSDKSAAAEVDRFLNSIVLLWKMTPGTYDGMRKTVLEVMKPCLCKLMRLNYFKELLKHHNTFASDFVESLEMDGWEVEIKRALYLDEHPRYNIILIGPARAIEWPSPVTGGSFE